MISFYSTTSKLRTALLLLLFVISAGGVFAQGQPLSGVVTDSQTKEPVIGATVMVNGTNAIDITDAKGAYSLNAPQGATVTASFLGYESRSMTVNGSVMDISLDPQSFEVDEVVVVGTVMRKSDLTGAVSGVSAKVLAEKPVTTVTQALQGRVAGVFISQGSKPTDEASIRIRGINTIDGTTNPIYVVDGVIMDSWYGGFSTANLADVASVEVLKDASATALYGSRGSNGVVVITTKKGQQGEGKVTYEGWVGIQTFASHPELMNTQQLYDTRTLAYTNGYIYSQTKLNNGVAPSQTDIDAWVNAHINVAGDVFTQAELSALGEGKNYDWLNEILRNTGIQHNHVLSFSNANDKGSFYLSFGYMDNKGLIKNTSQTRYTGRVNADYAIKKWLKVGTNTSFTHTFNSLVDDYVFEKAREASPFLEPNDTDVKVFWKQETDNDHNPLRSLRIDNHQRLNRLVSSNFINIEPIKGLNIRSTLSIDHGTVGKNKYTPNDINEATRIPSEGEAKDDRDSRMMWQWDNSISYDTTIGKHRINAMVGTSAMSTKTNWINATARDFEFNDFSYKSLGSIMNGGERMISSDWNEQALMSYLARASYSYDDRYLVTATLRVDGSSKFAPGYQWGVFPSVSAAWNIAEEAFMKNQNVLSQLKLRAGFGSVGNQNIDDFMPWTLYAISNGSAKVENERRGTLGITWEKQQQWNVGVDMAFLNNRINFSADAYLIDNKNLLLKRTLPTISGYKTATENIGAIRNRGIEFSLDARIIETKDFSWNFSATFSLDRNEVTELYGGRTFIHNLDENNREIQNEGNLFIGQPRNTFYMMQSAGIAQEEDMWYVNTLDLGNRTVGPGDLIPKDINGDGVISTNGDRSIIGSKDPKFYGGFATDFSWKGITLNAVFTYSYGAKRVGGWYNNITSRYGNAMTSADIYNNTWTPENTGAKFPRLLGDNSGAVRWRQGDLDTAVQDASYLRLSTLTLSYTFPGKIVNKIKMSNLRVYATGSNLFCLTPYKGYDPEYGDWYPATRMWTFGLNVSF